MSEKVFVCEVSELPPGERKILNVKGISIGVLNVEGDYHALSNVCQHKQGPVCEGSVTRDIEAEVSELGRPIKERRGDNKIITCPWHGWDYDLETGNHAGDPDITLPTFDVEIEEGEVFVVV